MDGDLTFIEAYLKRFGSRRRDRVRRGGRREKLPSSWQRAYPVRLPVRPHRHVKRVEDSRRGPTVQALAGAHSGARHGKTPSASRTASARFRCTSGRRRRGGAVRVLSCRLGDVIGVEACFAPNRRVHRCGAALHLLTKSLRPLPLARRRGGQRHGSCRIPAARAAASRPT